MPNPLDNVLESSISPSDFGCDRFAVLHLRGKGRIYAVIPVAMIQCSPAAIGQLADDLDKRARPYWRIEKASVLYCNKPEITASARALDDNPTAQFWVHPQFNRFVDQIRDLIVGEREFVSLPWINWRVVCALAMITYIITAFFPRTNSNTDFTRLHIGWPVTFFVDDTAARWFDAGREESRLSVSALVIDISIACSIAAIAYTLGSSLDSLQFRLRSLCLVTCFAGILFGASRYVGVASLSVIPPAVFQPEPLLDFDPPRPAPAPPLDPR